MKKIETTNIMGTKTFIITSLENYKIIVNKDIEIFNEFSRFDPNIFFS